MVGSINADVVAGAERHPAVGETVLGSTLDRHPGGKGANQAVAAAAAGAPTHLLGAVGDDDAGRWLRAFLDGRGVDTGGVVRLDDRPTGTALIVVAGGDNTIVVVPGANAGVTADGMGALGPAPGEVVVCQLEIPPSTVGAALRAARAAGATTVLNPAPAADVADEVLADADVIVVNETELAHLGRSGDPETAIAALHRRGVTTVVLTRGPDGVLVDGAGRFERAGLDVDVVDTTGAGDCFVGYLAAGMAAGLDLAGAVDRANVAAALSVTRAGAGPSMPTAAEVDEVVAAPGGP